MNVAKLKTTDDTVMITKAMSFHSITSLHAQYQKVLGYLISQ